MRMPHVDAGARMGHFLRTSKNEAERPDAGIERMPIELLGQRSGAALRRPAGGPAAEIMRKIGLEVGGVGGRL